MISVKFSERMGFVKADDVFQKDNMNDQLSNDIYNFIFLTIPKYIYAEDTRSLTTSVYTELWHVRTDGFNSFSSLECVYDDLSFYEKYDLLEFILSSKLINPYNDLFHQINKILENNHSAYRYVNKKLIPVSSKIDINNLDNALNIGIDGNHLQKALQELANRNNPNTITIVKESIDGLEYAVKNITKELFDGDPKKGFGVQIKILKENNFIPDHPSYLDAMSKIYGYSSDGGIRHPKVTDTKIDIAEATFMLQMCSAFISMLSAKLVQWSD